ncbi:alpha/beta hydrolase [Pseudokineococcus sp. 1T1Z-3]|uniref:alpha/beta hydrolase n=1 Tax=Pseudokineococcus sp. 1T1Z-3 TaxID=3132745 RepID=UPI00309D4272
MALPDVPAQTAATLPADVLAALSTTTDLLATWWPAALLGTAAVGAGALAVRGHGRSGRAGPTGRSRARTVVAAMAAVVLVALAGAAGANTASGYVPSVAAARFWVSGHLQHAAGHVEGVRVPVRPGSGLDPTTTYVYTPPGYDPDGAQRYPVVYLFHGTPGTSQDWFSGGQAAHTLDVLIAHHLVPPVLLVAPDLGSPSTSDTECLDSTRPGGPQVETHVGDVVRWVDAHYATVADPGHRVVAGMSMGGYCALDQGLRHPETYGAIAALEPYGDPGDGGRAMLETQEQLDAVSPSHYVPTMTFSRRTPVFLDLAADGDAQAASDVDAIADQLAAAGQPVLLRTEPGTTHSWTMARQGFPYGLVWTLAQLGLAPPAGAQAAAAMAPAGSVGAQPLPAAVSS